MKRFLLKTYEKNHRDFLRQMLFLAFRNAKQSKELEKNQKALEKAQITIAKLKEQNDKRDDQIKHLRSQKRQIESQGSVFCLH